MISLPLILKYFLIFFFIYSSTQEKFSVLSLTFHIHKLGLGMLFFCCKCPIFLIMFRKITYIFSAFGNAEFLLMLNTWSIISAECWSIISTHFSYPFYCTTAVRHQNHNYCSNLQMAPPNFRVSFPLITLQCCSMHLPKADLSIPLLRTSTIVVSWAWKRISIL